ncbi:MAG TPA: hypothetical protein PLQ50_01010 [Candidatus Woesebacteria bacterium]|nr:hypothetical protein [Candidatus Woesebacteria bacterium]
MKKKVCLLIGLLFLALSLGTTKVSADYDIGGGRTEIDITSGLNLKSGQRVRDVFNSTDDIVNLVVRVIFTAAGVVLFLMIIVAGFGLIKGGSGNKDQAKNTMTSAVVGFIVMFAAYWIMQILQLLTGINMGFK